MKSRLVDAVGILVIVAIIWSFKANSKSTTVQSAVSLPGPLVPADLPPGPGEAGPIHEGVVSTLDLGCRMTIKPPSQGIWVASVYYITERLMDGVQGTQPASWQPYMSVPVDYFYRCTGETEWMQGEKSHSILLTTETEICIPAMRVYRLRPTHLMLSVGRQGFVDRTTGQIMWPRETIWKWHLEE